MLPLSLYIHIPWCEKKCPYCDFNSHLAKAEVNEVAYVQALLADLGRDLTTFGPDILQQPLQSIFIGGGTPSLFSAESIQAILRGVEQKIPFADDIEITLEANPGSAERDKFVGFKQAGVNRLSIGVQSFSEDHLKALGRVHNSEEALDAADYARAAGFDNFNLDLMFGLPKQDQNQSLQDLKQAIALQPTHLSCYQLTIEPNTLFHHNPPITPDDEALWSMQNALQNELSQAGYGQYEVSAYAKANRQCRHNLNYWQYGDYLGIGAGAHGKITKRDGSVHRNWKVKHPTSYLSRAEDQKSFCGGENQVPQSELAFEFMMNALRLTDGVELSLFTNRTGLALSSIQPQIDRHQQQGLITTEQQTLQLTPRGQQMINSMLQDYLPD